MFSAIENLVDLNGAHVLDLYAGSGALGFEAASRGATRVVFVDSSPVVQRVLKTNIAHIQQSLGEGHSFQVITTPAVAYCQGITPGEPFDLVMMDPPYDCSPEDIVDCLVAVEPALADNGVVVVERAKKSPEPGWPECVEVIKQKTYGDTAVFYLAPRR